MNNIGTTNFFKKELQGSIFFKLMKTKNKPDAHYGLSSMKSYESLIQYLSLSVAMATNQNDEFAQKILCLVEDYSDNKRF